jgi:hypothetical protein
LVLLAVTTNAAELQWRPGRSKATAQASSPTQRLAASRVVERRGDAAVQPAAYTETGPSFPTSGESRGATRSLIIRQPGEPVRSAQLPWLEDKSQAPSTPTEAEPERPLEEELRSPFGELPEEVPPEPQDQRELEPEPVPLPAEPTQPEKLQPAQPPVEREAPRPPVQLQPRLPERRVPEPLPRTVPPPSPATLDAERKRAEEECSQGLLDLREKTIDKLDLTIAVTGEEGSDFPFECTLEVTQYDGRYWEEIVYMWKASALCHKPLYFEDEHLERYGHSWPPCVQPFVSGAHFFCTLPVLPYCMGLEPPTECVYSLGHYRPGSCAPYMINPVPLSFRAGLIQAGAVVGTAAAVP